MKRCPTCNSTYTNDALRFCLQDGAALLDVVDEPYASDPHRSAASEQTLEISGASPPTEIIDPRAAQTMRSPAAAPTAIAQPRFRRSTRDEEEDAGAPRKHTSPALIAAATAIIVLLLVLVGIGIALLLRGRSGRTRNAETETNRNANTKSDNHAEDSSANSEGTGRGRRADMTGEFSPAAARVEAKILRGASLTQSDIAGLQRTELRRLRNTVYARHGRIFERMELQQYFDGRPWYKKRADYTDNDLSPVDRDNINLIRTAEDRSP